MKHNMISQLRWRESTPHINSFNGMGPLSNGSLWSTRHISLNNTLTSHSGCVNTLSWDAEGSTLVSGSDDRCVMLWSYASCVGDTDMSSNASRDRGRLTISTGHSANVFGAKVLDDDKVVSCAGDHEVRLHCTKRAMAGNSASSLLHTWTVHSDRVKKLATVPSDPRLLWSAGEEGRVYQFDIRDRSATRIIDTNSPNNPENFRGMHAKTLALNPVAPHLIAVGFSDSVVRLYDRRMVSSADANCSDDVMRLTLPCVRYFIPVHLQNSLKGSSYVTHVQFSNDGRELIACHGNDYVHLFSITGALCRRFDPTCSENSSEIAWADDQSSVFDDGEIDDAIPSTSALEWKVKGNAAFCESRYTCAIRSYTRALQLAPRCALLYGNRAVAFLKRKWPGDAQACCADCDSSLSFRNTPPTTKIKAYLRRVLGLVASGNPREAKCWLDAALDQFGVVPGDNINEYEEINVDGRKIAFPKGWNFISISKEVDDACLDAEKALDNDDEKGERARGRISLPPRQIEFSQKRFIGYSNCQTDIKEACFLGNNGEFVASGSDDGRIFIWEKSSGLLVRTLRSDSQVVNCVCPHPTEPLLASSGIDVNIKMWGLDRPLSDNISINNGLGEIEDDDDALVDIIDKNHKRSEMYFLGVDEFFHNVVGGEREFLLSNQQCRQQ